MAHVLSVPFRISAAGEGVTVEQGSEAYYREQLVTILLTLQGERHIFDTLGMPDIAFQGFPYSTFNAQISDYLPEVASTRVTITNESDTTETVLIEFDITPEQA
jgi:hypothetical protein